MTELDPEVLFTLIASHIPKDLHQNVLIVGSLAAAYHHRDQLQTQGVNTKDADVVVQPAGALTECQMIAERLLSDGWSRYPGKCYPMKSPEPADELRAVRLHPPDSEAYYVELLGLPQADQHETKKWVPIEVQRGWYGLPCFRYFAVIGHDHQKSEQGLFYAAPAMMALANLLAHPELGEDTMSEPIGDRILLRSAKDLGRVLALAWLAGDEGVESWLEPWRTALRQCYLDDSKELVKHVGDGLVALLDDEDALDQARHANEIGLLRGRGLTIDNLRAVGEQIKTFLIDPLFEDHHRGRTVPM